MSASLVTDAKKKSDDKVANLRKNTNFAPISAEKCIDSTLFGTC